MHPLLPSLRINTNFCPGGGAGGKDKHSSCSLACPAFRSTSVSKSRCLRTPWRGNKQPTSSKRSLATLQAPNGAQLPLRPLLEKKYAAILALLQNYTGFILQPVPLNINWNDLSLADQSRFDAFSRVAPFLLPTVFLVRFAFLFIKGFVYIIRWWGQKKMLKIWPKSVAEYEMGSWRLVRACSISHNFFRTTIKGLLMNHSKKFPLNTRAG